MDAEAAERHAWMRSQARRGRSKDHTCPTCKRPNALTDFEAAQGYQCSHCTALDEGDI